MQIKEKRTKVRIYFFDQAKLKALKYQHLQILSINKLWQGATKLVKVLREQDCIGLFFKKTPSLKYTKNNKAYARTENMVGSKRKAEYNNLKICESHKEDSD